MNIEHLRQSVSMVINAPYFLGSMGFTVAIAMFVGAIIYDGLIEQAKKATVGLFCYIAMLLWVNLIRISEGLSKFEQSAIDQTPNFANAYNGVVTIFFLTIFWHLGVLIGVNIFRFKKKRTGF